jgi:hypothetical protein
MHGTMTLYMDQYGGKVWAHSVKELREKAGGGRVFKIYVDKIAGDVPEGAEIDSCYNRGVAVYK